MLKKALLASLSFAVLLSFGWIASANAAANYVVVDMACSGEGGVDVLVSWSGASSSAQQVWVDFSMENNGWRQGTFAGLRPITAGANSLVASALMPNAVYYLRVNQQMPGGWWDASPTFTFMTTPNCALVLAKPTVRIETSGGGGSGNGGGGAGTSPTISTPQENCHPSYYGACLKPDSPDYDCQGGTGDGPDFVRGPVYISGGSDPYELDRDGDGIGCNE